MQCNFFIKMNKLAPYSIFDIIWRAADEFYWGLDPTPDPNPRSPFLFQIF